MAEFTDFEAVQTLYIAPIWRKPRRIKSFKHAAEFVVKVLWLGRCVKASDRTVEFRYEQFKASESKKQRLHDLKCMARCKDNDSLPDEVQERRQHFFQVFRTKFRQLKLLEQMDRYNKKYCLEKPANDVICFGKMRHVEKSNIRSQFLLGNANRKEEARATMATPSKLAHQKRKPKVATNPTVITETRRTQMSFSTERSESVLAVLSTSSAKCNKSEERPYMNGRQDPRFQSLIRSLTPIDC